MLLSQWEVVSNNLFTAKWQDSCGRISTRLSVSDRVIDTQLITSGLFPRYAAEPMRMEYIKSQLHLRTWTRGRELKRIVVILSSCFVYIYKSSKFMDIFHSILTPFHYKFLIICQHRRWGLAPGHILSSFWFYLLGYWAILPPLLTIRLV